MPYNKLLTNRVCSGRAGDIGPRSFSYGPRCARSVLSRPRANIPQYGTRARLVRGYYFFLSACVSGIQQILQADRFREQAEFSHPARNRRAELAFIKNVSILSGNLLNDLCYYESKNLSVKPLQFNLDYLCFHYYLLARNCSVCCEQGRESCHDYSPKMFGSFTRLSMCCRKK